MHIRDNLETVKSQWHAASDIFPLLLIIGPDIVRQALAQLTGAPLVPVAFSFGWVAYSVNALSAVIGGGRLMPPAEESLVLINSKGHTRSNTSWLLCELYRDYEHRANRETSTAASSHALPRTKRKSTLRESITKYITRTHEKLTEVVKLNRSSLRIGIFEPDSSYTPCKPRKDWVFYVGCCTIILQHIIAFLPWILYGDYFAFLVTAAGTLSILICSMSPQWRLEKYGLGVRAGSTISILRGNGSHHVMVVLGKDHTQQSGLDLEILASSLDELIPSRISQSIGVFVAALSVALLITTTGIKDNTRYLMAVGGLGMLQNILTAGVKRSPGSLGIHLKFLTTISEHNIASTLRAAEQEYTGVGLSLVNIFFPGGMRVSDVDMAFWNSAKANVRASKASMYV